MLVELLRDDSFAGCPAGPEMYSFSMRVLDDSQQRCSTCHLTLAHAHNSKPHDAGSPGRTQGIEKCIQIHLTGHLSWQEAEMMRRPKLFRTAIEVPYEFRATG
jgi:hypothetical protein